MTSPKWAVVTTLAWAVQAVLVRGIVRAAPPSDVFVVMGVVAGLGASGVLAVRAVRGEALWAMSAAATGVLVGAEIIGVLGLAAFFVSLKEVGLAQTTSLSEMYPVAAALLGWAVLNETLTGLQLAGMVVAGLGIWMVLTGGSG